jgi:hypothetical protein
VTNKLYRNRVVVILFEVQQNPWSSGDACDRFLGIASRLVRSLARIYEHTHARQTKRYALTETAA